MVDMNIIMLFLLILLMYIFIFLQSIRSMNYTGYKAKKANILYLFVFILSQWLTQYTVKAACTVGLNHCMQCDSVNPNNCQRCQILYGITSSGGLSVCGPCPTGCQTCSYNVGNCTVCLSGYMHSIVTCIPCAVPGCSSCPTDINICTGCFSNYRFNAGACLVCNDVYCIYCDTNENICDYCYPGKGVNGTICIPCMDPNCQLCPQNYAQCYTCQVGLGVNSTFGCSPCTDIRCLQCSNNVNVCTRCQVGYGESGGICRNCVSGNCIACLQSTFSYCTACAIGYGPYFGSCGTCVPSFCQNCSLNRYNCRSCIYGYGLNTANNCEPCQTSISCLNCDGANSNECAVCQNNYFLDTGGLCSLCISGCQSCSNAITCNICRVGYYLDPASICLLCSRNCTDCYFDAVYGAPSCTSCEMNLGMSSQPPYQCLQNCGDFQAIDTPCDDQVGNKYDGCSDNCNVENGFLCQKVNYTSTCSYQNKIILEIVSIVQSLETNTFIMRVSVWPPLYVFRTSTLLPVFKITNPIFTITNIQFDLPTNQFIFKVDFNQTCWDCDLVLEFVPDPSIDERYFASVNSQASITVQLFYYSDFAFKISQFLPYFCYVIIVIGILAAFVGIFAKRLPGLESIIACQMAMISIIWINTYLIRPFSQLYPLQYVLGYHLNITTNHSNTSARLLVVRQNFHYSDSPYEIQFGFDQKILANNINLVLGLQAISLIFAVITSIIAECINHRIQQLKKKKDDLGIQFMKQKYTKVITVKQISLQCLMYIGMFNLVGFTAFTALFFINNSTYSYNIINLVVLSLGLLIYLCTFLLFWFTPDPFDYFRYTFKRSPFAMLYYYIYSLTLIFSVLLLELLPLTWPPLIPVGCLLIFTLAYQPYRQVKHNIRAAFNLLVILGFLSLRVIIKYNYSKSIQVNDFTFAFLLIDLILMFICVIIGLGFVVYQIIYNCFIKSKQKKNEKQEVMGQLEEMNVKKQMQNKQTIFGQLLTPKMNILEFSNMISFMNEQKINLCEQNLDNQNNQSARNLRKEMQKQKLSNNPLIKAQNLKIIQQKKQFINNLRQQMNNKQNETQLTEEQKEKNKKILYAMQIIDLQNTWIKLKHARDYTLEKIKEGVDKQFIEQYDRIL